MFVLVYFAWLAAGSSLSVRRREKLVKKNIIVGIAQNIYNKEKLQNVSPISLQLFPSSEFVVMMMMMLMVVVLEAAMISDVELTLSHCFWLAAGVFSLRLLSLPIF